jgi:hypothetical protein
MVLQAWRILQSILSRLVVVKSKQKNKLSILTVYICSETAINLLNQHLKFEFNINVRFLMMIQRINFSILIFRTSDGIFRYFGNILRFIRAPYVKYLYSLVSIQFQYSCETLYSILVFSFDLFTTVLLHDVM